MHAAIAQLVEHFIRNEKVVGSSPTRGSRNFSHPVISQVALLLYVFGKKRQRVPPSSVIRQRLIV